MTTSMTFMTLGTAVLQHVVQVARLNSYTIAQGTVDAMSGRVMVEVNDVLERRALARIVLGESRTVHVPSRNGDLSDMEHFEGPHRDYLNIPVSVFGSLPAPAMSTLSGRAL